MTSVPTAADGGEKLAPSPSRAPPSSSSPPPPPLARVQRQRQPQAERASPSTYPDGTRSAPHTTTLTSIIRTPTYNYNHTPPRPIDSHDSSGTLSPTPLSHILPSGENSNDTVPMNGERDPEKEDRERERKKRRVQWASAPDGEGEGGGGGGAAVPIEQGPDAQEHRESRARRREEERTDDERLGRELDERGLNRDAFRALRAALQTHQRTQHLSDDLSPSTTAALQQLDVYVPSDQTFGLPAPEPPSTAGERDPEKAGGEGSSGGRWAFVRAANRLVRGNREREEVGERPSARPLQRTEDSSDEPSPVKRSPPAFSSGSSAAPNLQGRGVLASLLAMYEQRDASTSFSSGASSLSTSAPSTPSESDEEASLVREKGRVLGEGEKRVPGHRGGDGDGDAVGWERVERAREAQSEPASILEPSPEPTSPPRAALGRVESAPVPQTARRRKTPGQSLSNIWHALAPGPGTPKAAQSGGGVLGSLIATTANLSGAAAPAPSSLAPQIGRSGFHLARYDMNGEAGDLDVEEERRRVKEERRRSWASIGWGIGEGGAGGSRPGSRPGSRGGSRSGSLAGSRRASVDDLQSEDEELGEKSGSTGELVSSPRPMEAMSLSRVSTIQPLSRATTTSSDATSLRDRERALKRAQWPGMLSLPRLTMSHISSRDSSPDEQGKHKHTRGGSYFAFKHHVPTPEEEEKLEAERKKEAERRRRKKQKKRRLEKEIFITMHVAAVLQRQEFLLKLARALMMFGAPTHRLEALIQATGRVLDMNVSCVHLPSLMLLSFNDDTTRTSETKFLKQPQALDLGRLQDVHTVYNAVIHDKIGVKDASDRLDDIMRAKSRYRNLIAIIIGGLCSAFITPISFSGSFLDAMCAFPLGCLLVLIQQLASKNELFTHVFEIVVALLLSFIAAGLAATDRVCYAAVASGSIVLILPGFIVLTGALELASRNIISGSVRMMYSLIYSLFLGFGLAIGAEFYTQITGQQVIGLGLQNGVTCPTHDANGPWWQQQAGPYWAFLCVPGFSLALSLRNQAPWKRKEFIVMILISCAGWTTNHFSGLKFVNRTDIVSMLGALVVGVSGNLYGRFLGTGMAFVVMVTGVLFQVPSSINGLLSFASLSSTGGDGYSAGFSIAEQLIEVSIGLTVGLFVAAVLTHPFESRRRGYGLFSF